LKHSILQSGLSHRILSSRILWFAALASLAAALAIAPSQATAQQPAPAALSAPAVQSAPAAQSQSLAGQPANATPTQEEQEHGFLVNGPIVKWTARTTGLSADTTATIYLFLNFAIIVFAIVIPLIKILPRMMRKRSETLSQNIQTAREATADANTRLGAIEARLAGLDDEVQRFRAQVEQDSLEDEKRIKAALEEESARIVAAAEQEIGSAAAQARRALRQFAAGLAIEQAEKQLVLTPETDRALIAEFVSDVTANGAAKGEAN
jgi:F-type H+-transporting ATPase subunit b